MIEGKLARNDCGRFEVNGLELSCGSVIEVHVGQLLDQALESGWVRGWIDHDGQDYVLQVGAAEITMKLRPGLKARAALRLKSAQVDRKP